MNSYTVLGLITAMILIAAATLAVNTPTETFAKERQGPNSNGCDNGEKDEGIADKCPQDPVDGSIIDQDDPEGD